VHNERAKCIVYYLRTFFVRTARCRPTRKRDVGNRYPRIDYPGTIKTGWLEIKITELSSGYNFENFMLFALNTLPGTELLFSMVPVRPRTFSADYVYQ